MAKKRVKYTESVTFQTTPEIKRTLTQAAAARGLSVSDIIREILMGIFKGNGKARA